MLSFSSTARVMILGLHLTIGNYYFGKKNPTQNTFLLLFWQRFSVFTQSQEPTTSDIRLNPSPLLWSLNMADKTVGRKNKHATLCI